MQTPQPQEPRALVYTLLYTTTDKDPASNTYMSLLALWLSAVARTQRAAALVPAAGPPFDILLLLDERTHGAVEKSLAVAVALRACSAAGVRATLARLPPPPTHHEGMFYKYAVAAYDGLRAVVQPYTALLYLDLDVVAVRPLGPLLAAVRTPGLLYVMPEGALADDNYSGGLLAGGEAPAGAFGFSAGMWACVPTPDMLDTLRGVLSLQEASRGAYCVDQPAMNVWAWRRSAAGLVRLEPGVMPAHASVNRIVASVGELPPSVSLINFMGEPGNGAVHMDKVLAQHIALAG